MLTSIAVSLRNVYQRSKTMPFDFNCVISIKTEFFPYFVRVRLVDIFSGGKLYRVKHRFGLAHLIFHSNIIF